MDEASLISKAAYFITRCYHRVSSQNLLPTVAKLGTFIALSKSEVTNQRRQLKEEIKKVQLDLQNDVDKSYDELLQWVRRREEVIQRQAQEETAIL